MPILNATDIDVAVPKHLRCLVLGETGTGKSIFASSFPKKGILFDLDRGALSYRGHDFDYIQVEASSKGWHEFKRELTAVVKASKDGTSPYKTLVIDSFTAMSHLAMHAAMMTGIKQLNEGPSLQHYSVVKNYILAALYQAFQFEGNLVVIGHIKQYQNDDTGKLIVEPLMIGSLVTDIPAMFDEILYASIKQKDKKNQFVLQTIAKGLYKARSRFSGKENLLPDFVPNDYNEVMKIAKEAVDKRNAKLKRN